ncbi:hypothetical protein X975_18336, partial [Stegodyphus mimosarum]
MWRILLMLFAVFQGVLSKEATCSQDAFRACIHLYPKAQMDEIGVAPDGNELIAVCPSAHEFFDCIKNFVSECFLPGDETTESLLVTGDLVKEICDEESEIHKDYIHSVQCYKSLEKSNVGPFCERRAEALYNAYLHFLREEIEDVDDADRTRHRYCIETAYKIACISLAILEDCDEVAHLTFLEVVHRSQSLRTICSQDMVEELNTMFLDFMEEDDAERRLLTLAFDIKRK